MSKSQQNLLNEDQLKILQCVKDGISHQKDISKTLGLDNDNVNYYLKSLEENEFIKGNRESYSGDREYDLVLLTSKGKVALKNLNNLIQEINMNEHPVINTHNYYENIGIGNMNGVTISDGVKIAGIINEAESEKLEIAVKEVQEILYSVLKTYPIQKTGDDQIVVRKTREEVEQNPQLVKRLLSAAKAGTLATTESMLNSPFASFIIAVVEDLTNNR